MKKKLEEGDIFYVLYKNKYFFAKILLDISNRILKKDNENKLKSFGNCYLVAVYKGIYDTPLLNSDEFIINAIYVSSKYFYSKKEKINWEFYRHEDIDYTKIEFPESLIDIHEKGICFTKGELEIKTQLTTADYDNEFKIRGAVNLSYYSVIWYACHYQERNDLMDFIPYAYLEAQDFRFAPEKRVIVYQQINEDPNQTYYELSSKHGFNLGRFYE
jgi:hypothetical protein